MIYDPSFYADKYLLKTGLPLKHDRGFTLIELLIVVVVVGVLSAITIAVINPAAMQNRAKQSVAAASLEKMGVALTACYSLWGVSSVGDVANCDSWSELGVNVPTQPSGWSYGINSISGAVYAYAYPTDCAAGGEDACCEMGIILYYDYRNYLSKPAGTVHQDNDCNSSNYAGDLSF